MARHLAKVVGAMMIAIWSCTTGAADPAAGQRLSDASCSACHGRNGIGIIPLYPNLAAQKREYLVAQLRAFRDGSRTNPIMSPMAVHLTDAQIEDVAEYLALLK